MFRPKRGQDAQHTTTSMKPQEQFRRPSIKDIARIAEVSHPTVSRALRNSPLVNPQTAERIRKIASEAGYQASAVARGLVMRRTRTVGLVVTSVADPFISGVVRGVEQTARDLGYNVMLADSNADPVREQRIVQSFAEQRLDGIIVTSSRVGALYLPMLEAMRVPIMLINNQYPGPFVQAVMIRNIEGTRAAVNHLIQLGHRRIAYLGDQFGYQSDVERISGYREGLEAARIPFEAELVVHGDSRTEAAVGAMGQLLNLQETPTAVCCYNDMTALGAMYAIHARGLRVPDDVSVTGFDDLFFAAYTQPPLTTVRQPIHRMGQLAMENLVKLISGEESIAHVKVDAELVIRQSTAPPRTQIANRSARKDRQMSRSTMILR
jgi:DNA-binding LacI/PurR family transcriptional regulator